MSQPKGMLCRDLEGRLVKLNRKITARGGWSFRKGQVMRVDYHSRGRFHLQLRRKRPPVVKGNITSNHSGVVVDGWNSFEVLPE